MPAGTLMHWVEQGEVAAEQLASGRWIIRAEAALIEQLRQRRQKSLSTVIWERWQDSLKEHIHAG
jgi:predicted site-specific integrase-resolvase